jgi:hypothetical protein
MKISLVAEVVVGAGSGEARNEALEKMHSPVGLNLFKRKVSK